MPLLQIIDLVNNLKFVTPYNKTAVVMNEMQKVLKI